MKKFEKIICLLLFFTFTLFLNKEVLAGVWKSCCLQGCDYSNGGIVEIGVLYNNRCLEPDCTTYICLATDCGVSWVPCDPLAECILISVCLRTIPYITISPSTQTGDPGQPLYYLVNITNPDSLGCGSSTFKLEVANCPSGWECSWVSFSRPPPGTVCPAATVGGGCSSPDVLVICPQTSNVSVLKVTPPLDASNGTYSFTVKAYNLNSSRGNLKSAVYRIECIEKIPKIVISPSTQTGDPGQPLYYLVNITNPDSLGCGSSTFKLEVANCPSGWNCSFTTNRLFIFPLKSNVSILTVTSPPTASNGSYPFTVVVYNEKSGKYDFRSVLYHIGCSEREPTISISPFYDIGSSGETLVYNVTVTNMDSVSCNHSVFILNVTSCPANWNCNLTTTSLLIPPQSSNSTTISVTSNVFSQPGNYSFSVKVAKLYSGYYDTGYYGEATAIYNIISVGNCSETPPYLILSTPYLQRGANISATIKIICNEWNYNISDLKLSFKIDNNSWNECFLNEKGLISSFHWNGTEQDRSSPHYKKNSVTTNGEWYCDDRGCKHQSYNLYVYSHSQLHTLEINFVCPLPSNLSFGTHTLSVLARLY